GRSGIDRGQPPQEDGLASARRGRRPRAPGRAHPARSGPARRFADHARLLRRGLAGGLRRRAGLALRLKRMSVVARMDRAVDAFVARCRWFHEPLTRGRARMFALQHRLNTRQRNSVLKLKVATNCSDWETRMRIIQACSEEVIADHAHGGGRAHWQILEDLGVRIGLSRKQMQTAEPLPSTRLCWAAWECLMANRHWLEGIVANTCAER